ncbi:hypothetical protein [Arthrobacter sp. UYEF3]|uniref:hypothetical protein n=1 Tax=Arthrobacter sp. UYEF3 TaxID=1756365 RepID=UPI003399599A
MHRTGPAAAADEGGAPADAVWVGLAEPDGVAGADDGADDGDDGDDGDGDGDVGDAAVAALWLGPQPLSRSAAAAAAVTEVITSLCFIC